MLGPTPAVDSELGGGGVKSSSPLKPAAPIHGTHELRVVQEEVLDGEGFVPPRHPPERGYERDRGAFGSADAGEPAMQKDYKLLYKMTGVAARETCAYIGEAVSLWCGRGAAVTTTRTRARTRAEDGPAHGSSSRGAMVLRLTPSRSAAARGAAWGAVPQPGPVS